MDNDILTIMRRELGDAVSTDPDVLALMRSDQSGHVSEGVSLMLVTARTIADVQAPCGSTRTSMPPSPNMESGLPLITRAERSPRSAATSPRTPADCSAPSTASPARRYSA